MPYDAAAIRAKIVEAVRTEMNLPPNVANEVAFHLTDWLADLGRFERLCQAPGAMTNAEVAETLMQFLSHVPNHVAAAGKLYADIPVTDIFKVGAITEE